MSFDIDSEIKTIRATKTLLVLDILAEVYTESAVYYPEIARSLDILLAWIEARRQFIIGMGIDMAD